MPTFGQSFIYDSPIGRQTVTVDGCRTYEEALWRAAYWLFRSNLTRRQIRKATTPRQREALTEIARRKLKG
jgi:hypothetical protein